MINKTKRNRIEDYYRNTREELEFAVDNAATDGERERVEAEIVKLDRWYDGAIRGVLPFHCEA